MNGYRLIRQLTLLVALAIVVVGIAKQSLPDVAAGLGLAYFFTK